MKIPLRKLDSKPLVGGASGSVAYLDVRLADERIRLMANQASASFFLVLLSLFGIGALFRGHMEPVLLSLLPAIACAYLLRLIVAKKILKRSSRDSINRNLVFTFSVAAALCGLLWGAISALWILDGVPGGELVVAFLIGGVAAGAIPSLGALKSAYSFFTLGILIPVGFAFYIVDDDLGPTLATLTLLFAAYLIVMGINFRKHLNYWLRLGIENEVLVTRLREEQLVSEQRLLNLSNEIEERIQAEAEAEKHRVTLANLLGNLPGMAFRAINDGHWTMEFISDGCIDILGLSVNQLAQQGKKKIADVLVSDDHRFASTSFRTTGDEAWYQHEYKLITPLGAEKRVVERGRRIFDDDGILVAIDGFITDVSEQFRLSSELSRLEQHDSLTGIFNRAQFEAVIQNILYKSNLDSVEHALLYLDLDQFKVVNDTCGHSCGDELLRQVSAVLQHCLRRQDILARLAGDEFGIFLENCGKEEACKIADELCSSIEEFRFGITSRRIGLTVSIGIATTREGLLTLEQLLGASEAAVHAAKELGRNRIHIYHSDDVALVRRSREMQWAIEIPEALNQGRIFLEWQQIVPVSRVSSEGSWFEVLIRMQDMEGKTIMPGVFLPAAERYNLALLIDIWVVKTVLAKLDQEPDKFDAVSLCFINLSGQSMGHPAFLDNVLELLGNSKHSACRICFEITETATIANKKKALKMMHQFRDIGCRFALDDFGSGFSSFGYLKELPVDYIKIDGSFVKGINNDPVNRSIVASINEIGHANGKKIIAEFVENDEILQQLHEIGVDYAQGYGIHRPCAFPGFEPKSQSLLSR